MQPIVAQFNLKIREGRVNLFNDGGIVVKVMLLKQSYRGREQALQLYEPYSCRDN
jgi:hypothetical protein